MDQSQQNENQEFRAEYAEIKKDVRKVVITNLIFLVLLVALYFLNRQYGFLDKIKLF